jgi:hypothetical protein
VSSPPLSFCYERSLWYNALNVFKCNSIIAVWIIGGQGGIVTCSHPTLTSHSAAVFLCHYCVPLLLRPSCCSFQSRCKLIHSSKNDMTMHRRFRAIDLFRIRDRHLFLSWPNVLLMPTLINRHSRLLVAARDTSLVLAKLVPWLKWQGFIVWEFFVLPTHIWVLASWQAPDYWAFQSMPSDILCCPFPGWRPQAVKVFFLRKISDKQGGYCPGQSHTRRQRQTWLAQYTWYVEDIESMPPLTPAVWWHWPPKDNQSWCVWQRDHGLEKTWVMDTCSWWFSQVFLKDGWTRRIFKFDASCLLKALADSNIELSSSDNSWFSRRLFRVGSTFHLPFPSQPKSKDILVMQHGWELDEHRQSDHPRPLQKLEHFISKYWVW